MDYILLDIEDEISEETLLEAIKKNYSTSITMKEEVKRLKLKNEEKKNKSTSNPIFLYSSKETKKPYETEINPDFEDQIEYYMSIIKSLKNEDLNKENLKDILPTRKNHNYMNIIMRLNAELLKEIKTINEIILENEEEIEKDDLEEFKEEIKNIQEKMNMMNEVAFESEENIEKEQENQLYFISTSNGNIRILDELDKIDQEFYESFAELFLSIKDGSFKNVKRFTSTNNKISSVSEVKDFKTRIIFDRIGNKDYVIISAFIKKCDTDKSYFELLINRIKSYANQKEEILEQLSNEDYIEKNKEIYHQVINKLTGVKVKKYPTEGGCKNDS